MSDARVKSDVTISVFKDETHLSVFEDDDTRRYIIKHGMTYTDALEDAKAEADRMGMHFISEYTETNEFGDPVTCLFYQWD